MMALISCNFYSETLGIWSTMNVILPQKMMAQAGQTSSDENRQSAADPSDTHRKYPTLWLLHGLSDDHTGWLRRTSIERYVEPLGIAVVMPAVNRSFYADMALGYPYWTFVSEELPRIARSFFPLSEKREDNFVAGLSMGGYGAFKLGLRCPERFAAAASLSGAVDVARISMMENNPEARLIVGDPSKVSGSDNDLFALAAKVAASNGPKPKLFQCCGTEDFLYEDNVKYRDYVRSLRLDLTYEEEPGVHEWGYWDRKIQRVLEWLPIMSP